jgi:hypothetical protein
MVGLAHLLLAYWLAEGGKKSFHVREPPSLFIFKQPISAYSIIVHPYGQNTE